MRTTYDWKSLLHENSELFLCKPAIFILSIPFSAYHSMKAFGVIEMLIFLNIKVKA